MKKTRTQHQISVMQSFVDGEKIQIKNKNSENWIDIDLIEPVWDWKLNDYQVKPSRKTEAIEKIEKELADCIGNYINLLIAETIDKYRQG